MLEGVLAGIESGWFQRLIAESAYAEQKRTESGELVKVGVSAFVDEEEPVIETLVISPDVEPTQIAAVQRVRGSRDAGVAAAALQALVEAATTDANLVEPLIACARARCTEGEIVRALEGVFGSYRETPSI